MRSIPFDVICLLGMNDTNYPRSQQTVSFDIMASKPVPGDRNRRNDDRYLFLEALVSARKVLYLSWVGHDQQDNSDRSPSVVVSELLDYLQRGYQDPMDAIPKQWVVEHPLQPFSRRCFDIATGLGSYAEEWYPGTTSGEEPPFFQDQLPEADDQWRMVDINRLKRFWAHPVRFFLQESLGLRLWDEDAVLPENEPFVADSLERYHLMSRLVRERLTGQDDESLYARMRAEGQLPHGGFGENMYRGMEQVAGQLEQDIAPFMSGQRQPVEVDLQIGDFHLTGWLDSLFGDGCVRFRPAKLKGRDMVQLWIDHLVLCSLAHPEDKPVSRHVATDDVIRLYQVDDPLSELQQLLVGYWQGLRGPLHFFPEAARAWSEATKDERRDADAVKAWNGGYMQRGEGEDAAYRIALRGRDPLDQNFRNLAARVFGPMLTCREK